MWENATDEMEQSETWKGRSYLYGVFSVILDRPVEMSWLKELFQPLTVAMKELHVTTDVWQQADELKRFFSTSTPPEIAHWMEEASKDYERLFLVPIPGEMVPLGASVYLQNEVNVDQRRVQWADWFERFSFAWKEFFSNSPGIWPNEPEHAALVLPMLSIIADEVATSMALGDEFTRDLQVVYRKMIGMAMDWLPTCLQSVEKSARHPLYRFLAALCREVLILDSQFLNEE